MASSDSVTSTPLVGLRRSLVSSPVTIPWQFSWSGDIALLGLSFLLDHSVVPPVFDWLSSALAAASPWWPSFLTPLLPLGQKAELPLASELIWVLLVFVTFGTAVLGLLGGYSHPLNQSRSRIIAYSLIAAFGCLSAASFVVFLARIRISRLFIILYTLFAVASFSVPRLTCRTFSLRRLRAGQYARNMVLVGMTGSTERLGGRISSCFQPNRYRVVGFLDVEPYLHCRAQEGESLQKSPLKTDLLQMLNRYAVDEVVAIVPGGGSPWLDQVIKVCDESGTRLRLVFEAFLGYTPLNLRASSSETLGFLPSLSLVPHYTKDLERVFVKRFLDLSVSALLLVLLAPVIGLIALGVWVTSGRPLLYRWNVVGQNGKRIASYKFRTMVNNADELKQQLEGLNEMRGPVFKMKNDPRVTKVGKILRKFSLDELPQLYSVLKGDLSLVGPRPVSPTELKRFEFWHVRKLSVRSGITCLWQVSGRNNISDFDEWVKLDLEYIDKWSLWLDIKILAKTAWVVIAVTGR